jgi:ABC-type multidrug transport system permease subunit
VEIPYQFVQTIIYGVITYFMMGFENNVGKISIFAVEMLPASCIWGPPKTYIMRVNTFWFVNIVHLDQ